MNGIVHIQVIGPNGLLVGKVRVVVTHNISVLPDFDKIVVVKDGRISEIGTYQELMDRQGAFGEFLTQFADQKV
jgi:ATP-binding cassette subfamily C (CFTR/MRP) protein 1